MSDEDAADRPPSASVAKRVVHSAGYCVWCRQDGCTPENEADCPCPHHAYFGRNAS